MTTDASASGTLTNLDNKIHGWGQFALLSGASFTLVNKGSVTADSGTGIALNCITVSNSGTLAGTPNGALNIIGGSVVSNAKLIEALGAGAAVEIDASTVVNTSAGSILASGNSAHVELGNGTTISGGMLKTAGAGAVIHVAAGATATLSGTTLAPGTVLTVDDASAVLDLVGTIRNSGTISVGNAAGGNPELAIDSAGVTLSGNGRIFLAHDAEIDGGTLTNVGNLIDGAGSFDNFTASVVNRGTIAADVAGGEMHIGTTLINSGTVKAVSGGTATLRGGTNFNTIEALGNGATVDILFATITNSGAGMILASGAGAHVYFDDGTVSGGTVKTSAGGVIEVVTFGTLQDTTIAGGASVLVYADCTLDIEGKIVNSGTITLLPGHISFPVEISVLEVTSAATLTGGGTIVMTNEGTLIENDGSDATLTNVNNLISGNGTIGRAGATLTLINSGTIQGGPEGILISTGATVSNSGKLVAGLNGGLAIEDIVVNGSGGVIVASAGALVELDATVSGGTLKTVANGRIEASANVLSGVTNQGLLEVVNFLELQGSAFSNSGTVQVDGNYFLLLDNDITFKGGGTVDLVNQFGQGMLSGSSAGITLTNADNKIVGGGFLGDGTLTLVNQSAGVVNGNDSTSALTVSATIVNSGVLEGTTAPGLAIAGNISNSKLIEALGAGAAVVISGGTVSNTSAGTILASGLGARVDLLSGTTVSGGTMRTVGFNAVIDSASGGTATFAGGTVASGSVVDVVDGSTLVLSGNIVNSGTIELTASGDQTSLELPGSVTLTGGGKVVLSADTHNSIVGNGPGETLSNVNNTIAGAGTIGGGQLALVNSGTINANTAAALTIDTGVNAIINTGLMETTAAGGLDIKSDVSNGGTLAASAGLLKLEGSVTGSGTTVIAGGGRVEITQANDAEHVKFALDATGRLILDQSVSFGGTVSGFGSGGNHIEAIDFADINSAGAHFTYSAGVGNTSGTLTVINGATSGSVVLIGAYTSGNFTLGNDGNGHVLITDPPVVAQKPGNAAARIADGAVLEIGVADSGKVTFGGTNGTLLLDDASLFTGAVAGFKGLDRIDLAQIGFGAETTLGYSANAAGTGGMLRVSDGVHTASLALLGNYVAASFATAADGHGGTLITEAEQSAHGPSLASPRHA